MLTQGELDRVVERVLIERGVSEHVVIAGGFGVIGRGWDDELCSEGIETLPKYRQDYAQPEPILRHRKNNQHFTPQMRKRNWQLNHGS